MTRYLHKIVECDSCGKRYEEKDDTKDIGLLCVTTIGWYGSINEMRLNIRIKERCATSFSISGDFCTKGCMMKKIRDMIRFYEKHSYG